MAKFPTEAEHTITVHVPLSHAYKYLWDVVGSSECIPGLKSCKKTGAKDTYHFHFQERSIGPLTMMVRYTAKYEGNGKDLITFTSTAGKDDNADVDGTISMHAAGPKATKVTLRQMTAPDTPVPRLLQGLVRSFVESETSDAVKEYLHNMKKNLEDAD